CAPPSSGLLAGAVVVASDRVIGKGASDPERSVEAIESALVEAGSLAEGATLYTTLAPGRGETVAAIIGWRVSRVVIGDLRPASKEQAIAISHLRRSGVEVETGVCEQECREVNEVFFKYSRTGLPFVTVKFASTLDGRIATLTGDSQWISSPASLRLAHELRCHHDAILVGIGTVLKDDPRLTVRLVDGRDPLRVIIDSRLRIPLAARVIAEGAAHRTLIATSEMADMELASELEKLGAEVLTLPATDAPLGVNLIDTLRALGRRRISSVLVEGGARIITSLLAAGLVDRVVVAIAPRIIGRGIEAIGDLGITKLGDAITFASVKLRRLGPDIIFDGRLNKISEW
ncbi:MAG TPA: bifunctional diaminohydroxyphosphoribosylaminopyrimidine deaminase/5-amino-6-(5-phosphoribosylamino)uracil reductase RibD, partial [Blastocatellia bacterium]|nr:bifunctional diaminohydroxyphosphoribosylaminopyrimidine deaminase/5-amino-6-(5-phosphoribosylamino)uracil reductase RibD [Blastocatellia bacterium]